MKTNISTVLPVEAWTSSLPTLSKDKVPLDFYSSFGSVLPNQNWSNSSTKLKVGESDHNISLLPDYHELRESGTLYDPH